MTIVNQNEKDFIKTADLALATVIYLFHPLEAIDKKNPRKAQFIFKQEKELDELIDRYWRGELTVEPRRYFEALRIIKARLYGEE